MKKFRLILFLLLAVAWGVEAATINVSKDPDNPGQYDDITDAMEAASSGDTLQISSGYYGSPSITKKLVFIGQGESTGFGRVTIREEASGSKFFGISFEAYIMNDTDDILIEKCKISFRFSNNFGINSQNIVVRNSIVERFIYLFFPGDELDSIYFENNIITTGILNSNSGGSQVLDYKGEVVFKNNLFINVRTPFGNPAFRNVKKIILENNIFYNAEPVGCTECTFINNLTFDNENNNLLGSESENPNSVGSGNIIGQDPLFEDYAGEDIDDVEDFSVFNLQSTSPAKGAGTDGTDLGIYGGSFPWNIDVASIIPEVTSLIIEKGGVPINGQLEFTFSAEKQ
ncbi:MAG: hypothetical protein ACOCXH_10655 [Cyclobacteriaceae bacterium]